MICVVTVVASSTRARCYQRVVSDVGVQLCKGSSAMVTCQQVRFVCVSACQFVYMYVSQTVCVFASLSVYLPACLLVSLPVCLVCLPVAVLMLSVCLPLAVLIMIVSRAHSLTRSLTI